MFKIECLLNHARRLWLTTPNSIEVIRVIVPAGAIFLGRQQRQ
jgi:hypothetical protein